MIILGPKTAILGPQFCRILVLGPHFWWSGGARAPGVPPGSAPVYCSIQSLSEHKNLTLVTFCSPLAATPAGIVCCNTENGRKSDNF